MAAFDCEVKVKAILMVAVAAGVFLTSAGRAQCANERTIETLINETAKGEIVDPVLTPVCDAKHRDWEVGAFAQGGVGLEDRTNFGFLSLGVRAGHMLSGPIGSGVLQGVPEYAVEVLPVWQSYTPKFPQLKCPAGATVASQCYGPVTAGGTYRGVSITPIVLRWNFTHGARWMPWVQAAGGVVYTTRKYPGVGNLNAADATQTGPSADTSVWNFTPQGGIGVHYFTRDRRSVDAAVNAVHISSSSLGDKNPGVNVSLMFSVGYTWWR
jgi:lipid A 3-O-deacylase